MAVGVEFNPTTHVVLGILLAVVGVLFTLDNLHLLHARAVLRYWPAALIVVGLVQITQSKAAGGWFGGVIWIVVGSVMLGNRLFLFDVNIFGFWPLLLVLIGVRMVAQSYYADSPDASDVEAGSIVSAISVLGGVDRRPRPRNSSARNHRVPWRQDRFPRRKLAADGPSP